MRVALALLAAAFSSAVLAQTPAKPAPTPAPAAPAISLPNTWTGPEYVMGSPKAKITVVEYASASCPHCARFDAQVFPAFKAKYVDTGKVRYIFREYLTPPENVAAAGFLLARCAGHDKYFHVVEQVFQAQPEIYDAPTGDGVKAVFVRIARDNGLNEAQLQACLDNKAAVDALNARLDHAIKVDKIESTPTILIDGQPMKRDATKELDLAQIDAALQPLLVPPHRHRALQKG